MKIAKWFSEWFRPETSNIVSKSVSKRSSLSTGNVVRIPRGTQALWEERGWVRKGNTLKGFYRTRRGSYEGKVTFPFSKTPIFYIKRPPAAFVSGVHGACFRETRKDEFAIHFDPKPVDVNVGIKAIEHSIIEALS